MLEYEEKGITLVALVVTIIVLLILAGVSINLVIGENGLIGRSKEATKKYQDYGLNEQIKMSETADWMDNIIKNNGKSTPSFPSGWDPDKVSKYESSDGKDVPVPDGFVVDESQGTTVEGGIVIKDSEGNEWVWVPVADPSTMFDTVNNSGQLYNFSGNTYTKTAYSSSGFREPAYLTNSTDGDASSYNIVGITKNSLQTEFDQMRASVEKYNGFYIGRYETGNISLSSGTKAVVQKGNIDISNQNWYTMYRLGKEMYSGSTTVQSSMIWGCQWDQVMIWMKDVPNITNPSKYYITDGTDMGNYTYNTFTYKDKYGVERTKLLNNGQLIPTGNTEISKVKNVYDMAGNVDEWTLEAISTISRVLRRW